ERANWGPDQGLGSPRSASHDGDDHGGRAWHSAPHYRGDLKSRLRPQGGRCRYLQSRLISSRASSGSHPLGGTLGGASRGSQGCRGADETSVTIHKSLQTFSLQDNALIILQPTIYNFRLLACRRVRTPERTDSRKLKISLWVPSESRS